MRILALDVSVSGCAVCVMDSASGAVWTCRMDTERGQAEMLIPMVDDIMTESGFALSALDCIAVTRGPGSFTGVRIGLSAARSLGLALNIPVLGFSTLDVLARGQEEIDQTLFLIDTKRGDYYGQIGFGGQPCIWSEQDIVDFDGLIIKDVLPDAEVLAKMATQSYAFGKNHQVYEVSEAPTPIYVRDAEVSKPKKEANPLILL